MNWFKMKHLSGLRFAKDLTGRRKAVRRGRLTAQSLVIDSRFRREFLCCRPSAVDSNSLIDQGMVSATESRRHLLCAIFPIFGQTVSRE